MNVSLTCKNQKNRKEGKKGRKLGASKSTAPTCPPSDDTGLTRTKMVKTPKLKKGGEGSKFFETKEHSFDPVEAE